MATAVQKFRGKSNRSEIINLRLAGKTLEEIGTELGLSINGVRHHQVAWLESIAPPEERAHELRETMGSRLERMHEVQWPRVLEGDTKAAEIALRIQQQFAKLYGLELQPGLTINVVATAEGMVAALGLDASVVDVEAEEITSESPD
jgi:hypothetical protein